MAFAQIPCSHDVVMIFGHGNFPYRWTAPMFSSSLDCTLAAQYRTVLKIGGKEGEKMAEGAETAVACIFHSRVSCNTAVYIPP